MRRIFFALLTIVLATGCKKDKACNYDPCGVKASATEISNVQAYLTSNSITATQHCSGVFYIISNPGTGAAPTVCNTITVTYKGQLTNGTVFDQGTITYPLSDLIRGWQSTLGLIKAGGSIRLFIPPSLGYGAQANGPIPANSILVFDVTLNTVR